MNSNIKMPSLSAENGREQLVRWYHRHTKHHFHAFAPGPGRIDWAGKPEEFRNFSSAPVIPLARPGATPDTAYHALYGPHRPAMPVDPQTISGFFSHSLAISAWKHRAGACWALRVNPSSGNLHPLEAYLALGPVTGLTEKPAICHYSPLEHALEQLQQIEDDLWQQFGLPENAFLVGLTVIHWRCSWKYGERAWRYCRLDAGHALAGLRFAAALFGWRLQLIQMPRQQLSSLFGLHRQDHLPAHQRETPELVAALLPGPGEISGRLRPPPSAVVDLVAEGPWEGEVELPDMGRHRDWPAIDNVEKACPQEGPGEEDRPPAMAEVREDTESPPAQEMIRRRRSATRLDRRGEMEADTFYRMLGRMLPDSSPSPWDTLCSDPLVDLQLMVHRVRGLAPGLYTLPRRPDGRELLAGAMNPEFHWKKPDGCPDWLPLYLNVPMDLTDLAEGLSCGQEMGGDAIFTLGMTADLSAALDRFGAPVYRRLYQEAGMIGQVLYLEAEAADLRGCGIGCYFDDGVHKLLGTDKEDGPQSLYHFVVGVDVPERASELLPPYPAPEAR